MKKLNTKFVTVLLLFLAITLKPLSAQTHNPANIEIDYSQDRLSLNTNNAPLNHVFNELAVKANIDVRYLIEPSSLPSITVSLEDVTLTQGVEYLLSNLNNMVFYEANHSTNPRPKQVWILGTDSQQQQLVLAERSEFKQLDDKQRSHMLLHLVNERALPETELVNTLSISLANDHNALVRTRAVIGLSKLDQHYTLAVLKNALRDESQSVRTQAIHALGKIQRDEATLALGAILNESTDPLDRILAVRALTNHSTDLARHYLDLAGYDIDSLVRDSAKTKEKPVGVTPILRNKTYTE